MRLRILSWNIHKGIGGVDRRYRLERVAQLLEHARPDVALLQEVADHYPRAGGGLQVEELSEKIQMPHFAFSPEHRFSVGGYGNAILSRWPIIDRMRVDLKVDWRKQRSALQTCIQLPESAPYKTLFATSLHLGLAERERRVQLERLFAIETHHAPSAPSILAGDFNDVFGTLEGKFMTERGYARMTPRSPTFPALLPFFSLDAIFGHQLRPASPLAKPLHSTLPNEKSASDHRPLLVDVELVEQTISTPKD